MLLWKPELILLVGVLGTLALLVGAVNAHYQVKLLQKGANRRLETMGKFWHPFRLETLLPAGSEREAFRRRLAHDEGFVRGATMMGGSALVAFGAWVLFRWTFFSGAKKRALRSLAGEKALTLAEIEGLAKILAG